MGDNIVERVNSSSINGHLVLVTIPIESGRQSQAMQGAVHENRLLFASITCVVVRFLKEIFRSVLGRASSHQLAVALLPHL